MKSRFFAAAIAAGIAVAVSGPALAHVTLEVKEAAIGSTYKAVLRVPHGCAGAATTGLRVQIPEGFIAVKPMPKPGWTLEIKTGPYAKPYENEGTTLSEGVTEIDWSGGNLPDAWYDEFVFRGTFAGGLEAGKFFFPVIQECGDAVTRWIDTSGTSDEPAPSVTLTPAK
jgi:uncharacterized protein YcnI